MKYDDPQLVDRLAAAYVLGTLHGGARRRLEALARESLSVQQAIWRWERRINPMADSVAPVQPRTEVWGYIEQKIQSGSKHEPRVGQRLLPWRALSAALGLAVLVLLIPLFQPGAPQLVSEQLALIQDSEQQPLWVVSVDLDAGLIRSRAINAPAREVDRVFQLWMLPAEGDPQSFGLLPVAGGDRAQFELSPAIVALLQSSKGLAVSIEPAGGSPTGLPTGPVVYTAPILEL